MGSKHSQHTSEVLSMYERVAKSFGLQLNEFLDGILQQPQWITVVPNWALRPPFQFVVDEAGRLKYFFDKYEQKRLEFTELRRAVERP
jgi:hypothetical protein